ncbi:hypothetical protein F2P81_024844 [Scophthalmus maximus]|uniref:Uncharacterized protein n=1 Tax=Scophthalmus maximus TaxID=52904 RepID=A0A6A4RLY6_SCOMX|nr:hypothetical protein F2P81_024844 [Scophthalmus maximus]
MQEDCECLFTLLDKKKSVEGSPGRAPSSLTSAHHRNTNKVGVTPDDDPEGAWTRVGPITDALSGEEYVSVSYIKPVLHLFNNTVLTAADDDTELTKDMKRIILEYLNEKYLDPETVDLLDMASLVDPLFKDTYVADDRQEFYLKYWKYCLYV